MGPLVFTFASKKELPELSYQDLNIPILFPSDLKKHHLKPASVQVAIVITGIGKKNSRTAARLIADLLHPLAVVNMGTCGINQQVGKEVGEFFFIKKTRTNGIGTGIYIPYKELPFPISGDINLKFSNLDSLKSPLMNPNSALFPLIDMEAGYQHQIFFEKKIPFFSVKIATDYCSSDTSKAYFDFLPTVRQKMANLFNFLVCKDDLSQISVIIPVKDRPRRLLRALKSVTAQTVKPIETIVIDDGSSIPINVSLREKNIDNLKIIRLKRNKGVSFCRNIGIKKATGQWIALLDSDDEWTPKKLENQVKYIKKHPFLEIVQCDEIWIRNGKRVNRKKHHIKKEGWIFQKSLELCAISPSGVLLKKDLIERFGYFDSGFPVCEDYDLWLRITRHKPVGLNPQFDLIKYGGHEDQLSRSYKAMDRFRVLALLKLLNQEKCLYHQNLIRQNLKKRLQILYNGALKRAKYRAANIYKELLELLEDGQEIEWQNYQILLNKSL